MVFKPFLSWLVFAQLVGISIGLTSSAVGIKVCTITGGIKKYKPVIKKKIIALKYYIIVSLAKTKLNCIEVLICKALTDSHINHDVLQNVIIWKKKPKI